MRRYLPELTANDHGIHVGLIGSGIQESRSPLMHMREARAQGFELDYHLFDIAQLDCDAGALPYLLDEIENAGFAGVNITHPCKQDVIKFLDRLSDDADDLGAVNTVIFGGDIRFGYNTDWLGFYRSFHRGLPGVPVNSLLQLGAGGAGSAVAYALVKTGVHQLNIFDVDLDKAERLADKLAAKSGKTVIKVLDEPGDKITGMDGIVNTTPVGMQAHPGLPLPAELLTPAHWVADVIYFPMETELLRIARQRGCRTLDGSGMAIHQAAGAFRLFTGKQADIDRLSRFFST
jgi:shikimate dehydrogenase